MDKKFKWYVDKGHTATGYKRVVTGDGKLVALTATETQAQQISLVPEFINAFRRIELLLSRGDGEAAEAYYEAMDMVAKAEGKF